MFIYAQMTGAKTAWVINGEYNVTVDPEKMTCRIPYSNITASIKHVGRPGVKDVRDYSAAMNWAKEKFG